MANIIGVDPGKMTGWAEFDDKGNMLRMGQFPVDVMLDFLNTYPFKVERVVYEDFRLLRKRAMQQVGSRFEASQIIGALKGFCRARGVPANAQDSSILSIAYMHAGLVQPGDHSKSHEWDAYVHVHHYLLKHKRSITSLQQRLNDGKLDLA